MRRFEYQAKQQLFSAVVKRKRRLLDESNFDSENAAPAYPQKPHSNGSKMDQVISTSLLSH